jgi:hypothetical protein
VDPDAEDHYAALGVRDDAPADAIEEAWKFGVLAFHPDRFRQGGQRERAERITKRLNAAWQTLGDPVARARLSGPMWRLRFTVPLGSSDGRVLEQVFRKMPQELSLAAGETVSVVFAPKNGAPRYLIRHAPGLDMGWRVD